MRQLAWTNFAEAVALLLFSVLGFVACPTELWSKQFIVTAAAGICLAIELLPEAAIFLSQFFLRYDRDNNRMCSLLLLVARYLLLVLRICLVLWLLIAFSVQGGFGARLPVSTTYVVLVTVYTFAIVLVICAYLLVQVSKNRCGARKLTPEEQEAVRTALAYYTDEYLEDSASSRSRKISGSEKPVSPAPRPDDAQ